MFNAMASEEANRRRKLVVRPVCDNQLIAPPDLLESLVDRVL
jgi:hypothetical protein